VSAHFPSVPDGVAEAHQSTMSELLARGVTTGVKSDRFGVASELLAYQTGMASPLKRLTSVDGRVESVVAAVARFVWLIAGSDRLEDIALYEEKVRDFSDDALVVPGSSYGRRLRYPAPGQDQIAGVIEELRKNAGSRRAAAVVWVPQDAIRESSDIPCTFGMFFHIRQGELIMTTIMRSNNAATLLPFNFFEFSMIGEIVASAVGVPFGGYLHWAASMHVFESARPRIDAMLAQKRISVEMPPMPRDTPLEHAHRLAILEARLRNAQTPAQLGEVGAAAESELNSYWLAFFRVLYAFVLDKRGDSESAHAVAALLPEYFRSGVEAKLTPAPVVAIEDGVLFYDEELESAEHTSTKIAASAFEVEDVLEVARILGHDASADELVAVVAHLQKRDMRLAARNRKTSIKRVAPTAVVEALAAVRTASS
jgi:thymidylate synthase